ncbi:MAG: protein kinase [Alistipes sp.]|nr:protein kinase [Alistipes sp.]
MFSLRQYLLTLEEPHGLTRTLGDAVLCRDRQGRPLYTAGNSAAVFRIRRQGREYALRCYFRPMAHAAEIYGERLLPKELYLYTSTPEHGEWVDVVLNDWIDGETLHAAVAQAAGQGDTKRLKRLSDAFDRLALELVSDDRAHGDLKPENIIAAPDGTLHPIDFDAAFLPAFAGRRSPEIGTAAFQHPARTTEDFDASLDDYPAALISTALHALSCDPTLLARHPGDGLLFAPQRIATDPALQEVLALFEQQGMAAEFRIARLLLAPTLRLPDLPKLLRHTTAPKEPPAAVPELFAENGLWGYRCGRQTVVPPLYDCGFDFSEGLAAVRLGRAWHFIDPAGRTVLRCPRCEAVKPFRNGRAQALCGGRRIEIDRTGHEFEY